MQVSPLISAEELSELIGDPDLRIFDCRFSLQDTELGNSLYRQSHIPSAIYAHLDRDLSSPVTSNSGRHPLPSLVKFRHRLEQWGIESGSKIVVYDASGGAIAARLWWMARWAGLPWVRLLDGGLQFWRSLSLPLEEQIPEITPSQLPGLAQESMTAMTHEFIVGITTGKRDFCLLDARENIRFAGKSEPIDPVAGHVPTAINYPYTDNLQPDGRFHNPRELRERFEAVLGADQDPACVVHMCGSGVTACHNILAMELADLTGSGLYAGSWSQWISDPSLPVETISGE